MGKDNPFLAVQFMNGSSEGKAFVLVIADAVNVKELKTEANAKWKITDGNTIEITMDDSAKKIPWAGASNAKFTFVVADNILTLTNVADKKETKFRKAGDKLK